MVFHQVSFTIFFEIMKRTNHEFLVPFSGRFGNQMFQICAAIYLAKILNKTMKIDARKSRPKDLLILFKSGLLCQSELLLTKMQIRFLNGNLLGILYDKLQAISRKILYFYERRFLKFYILLNYKNKSVYLGNREWRNLHEMNENFYGYFQDIQLVLEVWEDLKFRLLKSNLGNELSELRALNLTAVHIRLTDYLNHSEIGALSESYYLKCLNILKSEKIVIISDDYSEFIRRFPRIVNNYDYELFDGDDYESFKFLCRADKIIMANSTFSFWASIFSVMLNFHAQILMPNEWRKDGQNNDLVSDLFMNVDSQWVN
jgi:Glycosyl transferase family 11